MSKRRVAMGVIKPLWEWLNIPRRGSVLYGGRGGGKSWHIALYLILQALNKRERILCCREIQNSIKDSVYKLLVDTIYKLKLDEYFAINKDSITCISTGSEFIFKGLKHNIAEIKSTEGVTVVWVEEAQAVSEESWQVLLPTIRAAGSRFFITFNPDLETDPTYVRYVLNTPPGFDKYKINYTDNPFLSSVSVEEAEYTKKINPLAFANVWLGETRKFTDALVFKDRYEVRDFEIPSKDKVPGGRFFIGVDWGFGDPTACVSCFINKEENVLYVCREGYAVQCDLADIPKKVFAPVLETDDGWAMYADSARPETINYIKSRRWYIPRAGVTKEIAYNIKPVKKWQGSVQDGISYLQSFSKIAIHKSCTHTLDEFNNYSYEKDKRTGEVLPKIKSGFDHCIDSLRYALSGYITNPKLDWLKYVH